MNPTEPGMTSPDDALLTFAQVAAMTKLSRATIYRGIAAGTFPAPAKIGAASRWSRNEVNAWIAAALSARHAA